MQNAPVRKFKYPDSVSMRTYKPTVKGHIVQIKKVIAELEKAKASGHLRRRRRAAWRCRLYGNFPTVTKFRL